MPFAPLTHTSVGSGDTNTITTPSIDSTGAGIIVLALSSFVSVGRPTISDNKGNTWNALTNTVGTFVRETIFYCIPTTVGAGHTFTATVTGGYPGVAVMAFSGTFVAVDQQNGASASTPSTLAPGSVTPSTTNQLLIASCGNNNLVAGASSIDSGFTLVEDVEGSANNFGCSLAYQIQTTATTRNPAFTFDTPPTEGAARIATFKTGTTFTSTLAASQGQTATLTGNKRATKTLSATQGQTATLATTRTYTRTLSATQGQTATLSSLVIPAPILITLGLMIRQQSAFPMTVRQSLALTEQILQIARSSERK